MALTRATVLIATTLLALASSPSAMGGGRGIHFAEIHFDPPGRDDSTNEQRNRERVVIYNDSGHRVNLRGWTIHDLDQRHTYRFEKRFIFHDGAALTLMTGRGRDATSVCIDYCNSRTPHHYVHWDLDEQVWDNTRDRATIEKPDGRVVDRCGYGRAAHRVKRC